MTSAPTPGPGNDEQEVARLSAPRVLIVTVNPLSETSNNGKTFASFFKGYPQDSLAQLYFHREAPSSDVCSNYYRIGDEEYIRYHLRQTRLLGQPATCEDAPQMILPARAVNAAKGFELARLLRALAWTRLDLAAPGVREWLEEFDPEVIFFCGGDANYLYRPVLRISDAFSAPLVYYITDDYVLHNPGAGSIERLKRSWTRRLFKQTADMSAAVITIGEAMSDTYRSRYSVESGQLMNLVELPRQSPIYADTQDTPAVISYVGGLHLNRWKVLIEVADSLTRLSAAGQVDAQLDIFAAEIPGEAKKALDDHPRIRYRGSVPSHKVPEIFRSSRALLHVESFDSEARQATLLSVSTKIPEYLSSGRCIVAVGPPEVASIRYLADSGSAFVVTDPELDELDHQLVAALLDVNQRTDVISRGVRLAEKNHDGARRRSWFHNFLSSLRPDVRDSRR